MRSPNKIVLSRRAVDALPVGEREAVFWDRDLSGFGVRVHPTGSKVYMVHTRAQGKSRRVTIGRHGVWTPERARREAGRLIASLKAGETPRRPGADSPSTTGPTIAEMAERYMTEHVAVRCKPTTQRGCRHILDRFLLPRFGAMRLSEVTPDHVAALHYRMRDKPAMANQTVSLLSRLFYTAAKSGEAPAGGNPCRFIQKYPMRGRERFLSEQEFDRLGRVLAELETKGRISTSAAGALRLLMLTGCRRNENRDAQMGACRPRTRRVAAPRREDWSPGGAAVAGCKAGPHRAAAPARQPLGVSRPRARHPPAHAERVLAGRSQGGRARRRPPA